MASKLVNLSVHKNTVERRRKRELAKGLTAYCRKVAKEADIRAYAVVAIGADGRAYCNWDTGAILPMWAFPQTVASALERDMEESGVDEDWNPSLPTR